MFGDSRRHIWKTLVVVYQHSGYDPHIVIVREHFYDTLNIAARPSFSLLSSIRVYQRVTKINYLNIVGAAYGLADVTYQVQKMVRNNRPSVSASNHVFGGTYYHVRKTLGYGEYRTRIVSYREKHSSFLFCRCQ